MCLFVLFVSEWSFLKIDFALVVIKGTERMRSISALTTNLKRYGPLPSGQREKGTSNARKSIPKGSWNSGQTKLGERVSISEMPSAGCPGSKSPTVSGTQMCKAWPLEEGTWAAPSPGCKMKMLLWEDPCQSPLETSSTLGQRHFSNKETKDPRSYP